MHKAKHHRAIRASAIAATAALLIPAWSCLAPAGKPRVPVAKATSASVQTWSGDGLSGRLLATEHFDIVSTLQDETFEAALPGFLEAVYRRYAEIIPPTSAEGRRLTTYIFGNRWEWDRFTRRRFASNYELYARIISGGFAEGTTSVSFHRSRSSTLATLAHEGWHQYVAAHASTTMPAWLNEGFACYHETVDFAGAIPRFTPQRNTFRINNLRDALQTDQLLPLGELIETNAGTVIGHHHSGVAQIYYAQVWALVTFLKHGSDGRHAAGLQLMLDHIVDGSYSLRASAARLTGNGDTPQSAAAAAFRTYFSTSVERLAKPYREHLMRICGFSRSHTSTSE